MAMRSTLLARARPVPGLAPSRLAPDPRVDAITRRSPSFPSGKLLLVPTRQQNPPGPILIAPANPARIELWIRALRQNGSNLVFIGGPDVSGITPLITGGGSGYTGGDGWEMEAGDVIVITASIGSIWAVANDGAGTPCLIRALELVDQGPQ
jgi:hypothetical protein